MKITIELEPRETETLISALFAAPKCPVQTKTIKMDVSNLSEMPEEIREILGEALKQSQNQKKTGK